MSRKDVLMSFIDAHRWLKQSIKALRALEIGKAYEHQGLRLIYVGISFIRGLPKLIYKVWTSRALVAMQITEGCKPS
jgi:hypothetical protein